jgi:16S rRNA (guanine966-N2)-methyltransferase
VLRIIAGRLKGRRLATPTWPGLRPTSDRLRETLFNILAPHVAGARVLDAYAGTGALGLEALSRGAAHVTFADSSRRAAALIQENLAACDQREGYTIECGDVVAVVRGFGGDRRFDLIILDPPYEFDRVGEALQAAAACLEADGIVVLERATRREPDVPPELERYRDVRAGDSTLTFFRRASGDGLPESA